jgi:hypothetical protein
MLLCNVAALGVSLTDQPQPVDPVKFLVTCMQSLLTGLLFLVESGTWKYITRFIISSQARATHLILRTTQHMLAGCRYVKMPCSFRAR